MSDDQKRSGVWQEAAERHAQILRVERSKALVQNDKIGVLQERPGYAEPAPLAVRELPADLFDHLREARRHPLQQLAETEFTSESLVSAS